MKLISLIIVFLSIMFGIQLFAMVDISMGSYKQNLQTTKVVKTRHVPDSVNIEYKSFHEKAW